MIIIYIITFIIGFYIILTTNYDNILNYCFKKHSSMTLERLEDYKNKIEEINEIIDMSKTLNTITEKINRIKENEKQ